MNLDEHGAACRCLLRLRENEGLPGISDAAFIGRFLPRYPEWRERPGEADVSRIAELARELELTGSIEISRDYARVLQEHQAGHGILVFTERIPEQRTSSLPVRPFTLTVAAMDAEGFTLWCPYTNGHSDNLPRAERAWWDRWLATALVLRRAAVPARRPALATEAAAS